MSLRRAFRLSLRIRPIEWVTLVCFILSLAVAWHHGRSYDLIYGSTLRVVMLPVKVFLPCFLLGYLIGLAGVGRAGRRRFYLGYFCLVALVFFGGSIGISMIRTSFGEGARNDLLVLDLVNAALAAVCLGTTWLSRRQEPRRTRLLVRRAGFAAWRVARLSVCLLTAFVIYSNMKALVPLIHGGLHDDGYLWTDCALFFGHNPFRFLNELPFPWLPSLMMRSYLFFFFFVLSGMAGALLFGSTRLLERVVASFIIAYVLGAIGHQLVPALGPAFTGETAAIFAPTQDFVIRKALLGMYQAFLADSQGYLVQPFNGLAPFPSLHVAHSIITLHYLRRCERRLAWVLFVPFVLLVISTVYLGIHYVIDLPGGVVVAGLSIAATRKLYGVRIASPSVVTRPEPGPAKQPVLD